MSAPPTLDWRQKQEVRYAVPMWLRDQHIQAAIRRVPGRITPVGKREMPAAIVGFGPSLQQTWEQVRNFAAIITCSGSHRFLLDRGLVPTYHVEVDPRPHKVTLLGPPDPRVTYLPASTCCPEYFDHLEQGLGDAFKTQVQLWHVFDASDEGVRTLPPGEWAVLGGCDAGLRAITLAAFLGFRDLHIFGMDGCAPAASGSRHAGPHPNGTLKAYSAVEYEGQTYWTTPGMLEAARQIRHELAQLPAVTVTWYGDGLTQRIAQRPAEGAEPPNPYANIVGFVKPETISAGYVALNSQLHRQNPAYGVGGEHYAPVVEKICKKLKTKDVLDYGCGKGRLAAALPFHIQEYDPAIPGKQASPKPAEIVVCTDVLEHVEPDHLTYVLEDLRRCVRRVGYFVVHTGPAGKTLPDGRNAHLIQQPAAWWAEQLGAYFQTSTIKVVGPLGHFVVSPKRKAKAA